MTLFHVDGTPTSPTCVVVWVVSVVLLDRSEILVFFFHVHGIGVPRLRLLKLMRVMRSSRLLQRWEAELEITFLGLP